MVVLVVSVGFDLYKIRIDFITSWKQEELRKRSPLPPFSDDQPILNSRAGFLPRTRLFRALMEFMIVNTSVLSNAQDSMKGRKIYTFSAQRKTSLFTASIPSYSLLMKLSSSPLSEEADVTITS